MIFEAAFDPDTITATAVRNRLAVIYGIDPSLITYTTTQTGYGPLLTYRQGGQNRLRVVMFGGQSATWNESRLAAIAYLADNAEAWGE